MPAEPVHTVTEARALLPQEGAAVLQLEVERRRADASDHPAPVRWHTTREGHASRRPLP